MIIEPSRNLETDYAYDVAKTEKEQLTTMLTRAGVLWSEGKFIDKHEPSPPGATTIHVEEHDGILPGSRNRGYYGSCAQFEFSQEGQLLRAGFWGE
jgi:hypothetical protein